MLRHAAFVQFANVFPLFPGSWAMLSIINHIYKKLILPYEEKFQITVCPKWIFTTLGCIWLFTLFVSLYICIVDLTALFVTQP